MQAVDFIYDGVYLSDLGFIIGDIGGAPEEETESAGSTITFNKEPRHRGKRHILTSAEYEDCLTCDFTIIKNPELFNTQESQVITEAEHRNMLRWLARREFLPFYVLDGDRDNTQYQSVHYNASFNVEKIMIDDVIYGLQLTMESDSPFGYGGERKVTLSVTDTSAEYIFEDENDEIGYSYPTIKITINEAGDLALVNKTLGYTTQLNNCSVGEVITLHGDSNIITTSLDSHNIVNDFNYEFFKVGNSYSSRENIITASLLCTINIIYEPTIKDTP